MDEALGWIAIVAVLFIGAVSMLLGIRAYSRKPVEEKYERAGGGLGGAFDAVWSPTAHEAGLERDRQTQRTAPAPSPGDPPDSIDEGHITLRI